MLDRPTVILDVNDALSVAPTAIVSVTDRPTAELSLREYVR